MRKKIISVASLLSVFLLLFGCLTHLKDYQPKSPEEDAIKTVLVNSENAWNNNDLQGYLAVLHESGQFMYGTKRYIVSKKEFAERIPQIKASKPVFTFGIPKITITKDTAVVNLKDYNIPGGWPWTVHMVREKEKWYIMSNEYPAP